MNRIARTAGRFLSFVMLAAVFANGVLFSAHGATLPTVTSATLKLHLDAALGVTDAGGGAVSAWADQSSLGNNFNQTSGSLQPVLAASQINGLPAVVFTSDRLDVVGTGLNHASPMPFTFFAVTTGASSSVGLFDSAPFATQTFRFSDGNVEIWNVDPSVGAPVVTGGSVLSINAYFHSLETTRRQLSVRSFDSAGVTAKHGFSTLDTGSHATFNNPDIGTMNANPPYFSGGIAEMLIYYRSDERARPVRR